MGAADVGGCSYDAVMGSRRRQGSDSRCCTPDDVPYVWRDYVDPSNAKVLELQAWMDSLRPFARAIEEGEQLDLFDAAAHGDLYDTGDEATPIKPIVSNPEIFELRRTALSQKLRFYHGEPPELSTQLVSVHRHIKDRNDTQQVEIDHAADRYDHGRPSMWVPE